MGRRVAVAVEHRHAVPREPVLRAEAVEADRARERADRVEPVVVDEDDRQLHALLDRGDELARQHQVGAVADEHVDVALGRGHLHADAAGDLVAHARVAVLDVVALRVAGAPELVQVARHRARGADDDARRRRGVVDRAEHLALRRQRPVARASRGAPPRRPTRPLSRAASARYASSTDQPSSADGQPLERDPRVGDDPDPGVLGGVEVGDVDVHEAHAGSRNAVFDAVVKSLQRVPTPITRSAAAAIRLAANVPVAPIAPRHERVVVGERALARLRLAHGNAGRVAERAQRVGRLRVDDAAARDDQRPARRADRLDRLRQRVAVGQPDAERARPAPRRTPPDSRTPRPARPAETRA